MSFTQKDIKPVSSYAKRNGAKILSYGPPGGGKTPSMLTAPNPFLILLEKGTMSIRNSNAASFQPKDAREIDDVFDWIARSKEAQQFDTICVDSLSAMAEMYLHHAKNVAKISHGLQQYGFMAEGVRRNVDVLYYTWPKHVYGICQMDTLTLEGGSTSKRPGFPGKDLAQYVPHLFDIILYCDKQQVPGFPQPQLAFRTAKTFGVEARDRSGTLAELEPQNLANLIAKIG